MGDVAVLKGQGASRDDVGHGRLAVAAGSNLPLGLNICGLHGPLLHHDVHIHLETWKWCHAMPEHAVSDTCHLNTTSQLNTMFDLVAVHMQASFKR